MLDLRALAKTIKAYYGSNEVNSVKALLAILLTIKAIVFHV